PAQCKSYRRQRGAQRKPENLCVMRRHERGPNEAPGQMPTSPVDDVCPRESYPERRYDDEDGTGREKQALHMDLGRGQNQRTVGDTCAHPIHAITFAWRCDGDPALVSCSPDDEP